MKRLLALTTAIALLCALVAACGGGGAATTTAAATTAAPATTAAAAAETTAAAAADDGAAGTTAAATEPAATTAAPATTAAAAPEPAAAPEEPRVLTIAANRFAQHVDWDQMYIWQKFEEDTGIKVNWDYIPAVAIQEQRNLRVSTNNLPDAFYGGRWTPGEIAQYTSEGVFVPIEGYLNMEYAPNTTVFYDKYPSIIQGLYLFDGHIYGWPVINIQKAAANPMFLRESWMNELGLAMPETPNDILNIMLAMKQAYPDALVYTDYEGMRAYAGLRITLMGAWGLGNRGQANENWDADPADPTKVRFIPTDDRFKELLALMHEMYAAGCIDPDALTQEEVTWGAKCAEDNPATIGVVTNDVLEEYNLHDFFIGTGPLTGPYGDEIWSSVNNQVARPWNYIITKACKNVPLAVEFADYWMCDEASVLFFRGAEHVHWEWDETGTRHVAMDWIKNDPDGRSEDQMRSTWTSQPGGSYFGYSIPEPPDMTNKNTLAILALDDYLPEIVWPTFSLSLEETNVTSAEGEDIATHYRESVTQFVNGKLDLSKDWDSYVKKFDAMGLEKLRNVYQSAYDRYLAAGGKAS